MSDMAIAPELLAAIESGELTPQIVTPKAEVVPVAKVGQVWTLDEWPGEWVIVDISYSPGQYNIGTCGGATLVRLEGGKYPEKDTIFRVTLSHDTGIMRGAKALVGKMKQVFIFV